MITIGEFTIKIKPNKEYELIYCSKYKFDGKIQTMHHTLSTINKQFIVNHKNKKIKDFLMETQLFDCKSIRYPEKYYIFELNNLGKLKLL